MFEIVRQSQAQFIRLREKKKIVCWLSYGITPQKTILLYTIQTVNSYQHRGYGSKMLEYFINLVGPNRTIIAKIMGGYENQACIQLLSKYDFKPSDKDGELEMIRHHNKYVC